MGTTAYCIELKLSDTIHILVGNPLKQRVKGVYETEIYFRAWLTTSKAMEVTRK
jgi:hypothetical protein